MRKLNKALSVVLTICMIVGMLPLSAYAADSVSYLYYADEAAAIAGTAIKPRGARQGRRNGTWSTAV